MASGAERLLEDLQHVMTEIEDLVKESASTAGDGAGDAMHRLQSILIRTRDRFGELERMFKSDVQRGAHAADRYMHENTWKVIATAAGTAFVLGVLLGRRN
jgi:ElaB/YqjD/DUF883 family membrane-anchored ribosome-binding protein